MKKSQLKESIKSEIKSLLSEGQEERESKFQQAKIGVGLTESLNPEVSRAVDRFITAMADRYGYSMQDAVYAIMAALKQRNYDGLNEEEDDIEPTAANMDKEDSIASKGNKLQSLIKNMKEKAKEYKAAEGDEKESIKKELKKMTNVKNKLEKDLK